MLDDNGTPHARSRRVVHVPDRNHPTGCAHVNAPGNALVAHAHSSEHNEHYTPEWLTNLAHEVLHGITLDPMSSRRANETIRAPLIYTATDDACARDLDGSSRGIFSVPWTYGRAPGRVWLNPPGGKLDPETLQQCPRNVEGRQGGPGLSAAATAFGKLSHEWILGRVECALFLCFSLNVFRTAQSRRVGAHFAHACAPSSFPFCIFRERIRFETIDADGARSSAGVGAPQDSALVFLPPRDERDARVADFAARLSPFGHVRI